MKLLLILTILLSSVNSIAVTPISKGEIAPHSGYIFTKPEEKKVRKIVKQKITLEKLMIKKNQKIAIQTKRITILHKRVDSLKSTTWGKVLYFLGGVILTSASLYGANKILN